MEDYRKHRAYLKSSGWEQVRQLETDQKKGILHPDLEKGVAEDAKIIKLPAFQEVAQRETRFYPLFQDRKSHRKFKEDRLLLEEVSFLLWAIQGVKSITKDGATSFRTVPSGGSRHPFETYVFAQKVDSLDPGLYRYLPITHELVFLFDREDFSDQLTQACLGQQFVGQAPVSFIWTSIPYRTEWRYAHVAHKIIGIDAGHMCQNLYLAVEAIDAGTCGIGAYNQQLIDQLLDVDGNDEFVIYLAPIGKVYSGQ